MRRLTRQDFVRGWTRRFAGTKTKADEVLEQLAADVGVPLEEGKTVARRALPGRTTGRLRFPSLSSSVNNRSWPGFRTAAFDEEGALLPPEHNCYELAPFAAARACFTDHSAAIENLLRPPDAPSDHAAAEGLQTATERFAAIVESPAAGNEALLQSINYVTPEVVFPAARGLQRSAVFHVGGALSGRASGPLRRLARARSGLFASRCWIQAAQVYSLLMQTGVACDLRTRYVTRTQPGSRHTVCTIDEIDYKMTVECAIVEDADLASDGRVGWQFTRAALGIPARELHLLTTPACFPLLLRLAQQTGDKIFSHYYPPAPPPTIIPRRPNTPLCAELEAGDLVVVASQAEANELRKEIASRGEAPPAVIHDNLPLEVIAGQLAGIERRVLILDAGLAARPSLKVDCSRVVIADSVTDGVALASAVHRSPKVVMAQGTAAALAQFRGAKQQAHVKAGVLPSTADVRLILEAVEARTLPYYTHEKPSGNRVRDIVTAFRSAALIDTSRYFICKTESQEQVGQILSAFPLTPSDLWEFCSAPFDFSHASMLNTIRSFAAAHAAGGTCPVPSQDPTTIRGAQFVEACELCLQQLELYYYLSLRFHSTFSRDREVLHGIRFVTDLLHRRTDQNRSHAGKRGSRQR
ncbi:DExH-box ATP-dependent RNA helicase DExH16 [Diplonema papillatum]|nr:DExH-box ATP-dependent RNA helicase DExH16 [Diplonema papillatum]